MSIYHGTTHIQGTKTDCSIHNPVNATQNVLELVFHYLLENPNYPKIDRKGRWTRTEDDEEGAACRCHILDSTLNLHYNILLKSTSIQSPLNPVHISNPIHSSDPYPI
ncbi:hypothetical protein BDR04DRAFT_1152936 [Suillus decipiens]|nr:hypothetical protein BDR04DRAFT_1152936 [Suillus decipiens]